MWFSQKRYICGEKEAIVIDRKRKWLDGEDKIFAHEVEDFLIILFPKFGDVEHGFSDFHNFSLNYGKPVVTVLVSTKTLIVRLQNVTSASNLKQYNVCATRLHH